MTWATEVCLSSQFFHPEMFYEVFQLAVNGERPVLQLVDDSHFDVRDLHRPPMNWPKFTASILEETFWNALHNTSRNCFFHCYEVD